MIGSEKLCEGNLSTPLLEGLTRSDAARSFSSDIGNSDCENRAKREIGSHVVWKRRGGSWVSHVPSRKQKLMQVRPAGQAGYPISLVASLDTVPVKCCVPLHWIGRRNGNST